MKPKLTTVSRAVEALQVYEGNARTHSEAQVAQLAASITEFGWTNPVLIDEKDGIIAGHGRVMAAKSLGLEHVDCIVLKGLTDKQRRAYVIADNKLALNAGWNDALLKAELTALSAEDFDLMLTGFSEGELTGIFLDVQQGKTNADEEWEGMPEFDQPNAESFRKLVVHFKCQSDLDDFARLIGQSFTDRTRSIWHPYLPPGDFKDLGYQTDDGEDAADEYERQA